MTLTELQHAAAVCLDNQRFDPGRLVHKDTLVALCHGLLVVDEDTSLVRLVRESLPLRFPRFHLNMVSHSDYTAKDILQRLILETHPRLHPLMASFCIGRLIAHGFQRWKDDEETDLESVVQADPLLPYAYNTWSIHARNSLNDPTAVAEVKEFVRGCQSFPMTHDYCSKPDLLGPLHVVAAFNLPTYLVSSEWRSLLSPNPRTRHKETPLHLACRHTSDLTGLEELLSLRLIDVNATNRFKETPLICAIRSNNVGAVNLLLGHPKIRVDMLDDLGRTAFIWATIYSNQPMVEAMLAHSRYVIHLPDGMGQTALSWACWTGDLDMVKLLLSYSPLELRMADKTGRTPLSWAATSNHRLSPTWIDTLRLILSLAPDDVHLADEQGRTPLSWAVSDGETEAVEILLAYPGTDINQVDKDDFTPLLRASLFESDNVNDVEALKMRVLLAHPQVDVNSAENLGLTPLMHALFRSWGPCLTLLLSHPEVDVNLPSSTLGKTPLHLVATAGKVERVKLLLAHPDIKVNVLDFEGSTPLVCVAMQECESKDTDRARRLEEVAQALLAHPQTDVNLADNKGRTALSWASKRGHDNIVKLLLEHPQTQSARSRGLGRLLSSTFARGKRRAMEKVATRSMR